MMQQPNCLQMYGITKIEQVYAMDALFEHIEYDSPDLTFMLIYSLENLWRQELFNCCRYSYVRDAVKIALDLCGEVYIIIVLAEVVGMTFGEAEGDDTGIDFTPDF